MDLLDSLGDALHPYQELVGSAAAIVTTCYMFTGTFLCWDIYKQGSTKGVPAMPFLGGFVMSLLNLKFGYMLRDPNMIQVNLYGIALNIIYLMVYYWYSQNKMTVWGQIGIAGAFSGALIVYTEMEDPKLVEYRFGMILTGLMFGLIASPLFDLKEIIRKKSTEGMPFPMILAGTIVSSMWLLYGIILKNQFLIIQNVVAVFLSAIQLALFVIFPSKPKKEKSKEKAKAKKAD